MFRSQTDEQLAAKHVDVLQNSDSTYSQVELYEGAFEYVDAHPEFARSAVNRALTIFREQWEDQPRDLHDLIGVWLADPDSEWVRHYTSAEIDHARKVLTRLAALQKGA